MTTAVPARSTGLILRSLRAITGLYLLAYVASHLINLSLGLISLDAMDAARPYLTGVWLNPVTKPILGAALLVHYILGLWSVFNRPSISGTPQDMVQALSGLTVIPLLAMHVVGTYMLKENHVTADYALLNQIFWLSNPGVGLIQVLSISVIWVHGCAGFFMLLRARAAAVRVLPWLYPLAVAVPVVALLGYAQAGRIALIEGGGPVLVQAALPDGTAPPAIDFALIKLLTNWVLWGSAAMGLLVLVARWLRVWLSSPASVVISTQGVGQITGYTGASLLDALRHGNQPHASLCTGRGRCGTCAVRVLDSDRALPLPTPLEQATLDRLGMEDGVRLACQLPLLEGGALRIDRLYPPDFQFENGPRPPVKDMPTEVPTT